jgi:hypothetical protein
MSYIKMAKVGMTYFQLTQWVKKNPFFSSTPPAPPHCSCIPHSTDSQKLRTPMASSGDQGASKAKNLRVLLRFSRDTLVSATNNTTAVAPPVTPAAEPTDWLVFAQSPFPSASPTSSQRRSVTGRPLSSARRGPAAGSRSGPSRSAGTATARSWAAGGRSSRRPPASRRGGSLSSATVAAVRSP